MRGQLMRLFTADQHRNILKEFTDDAEAAIQYTSLGKKAVTRQNVTYWRKVFEEAASMADADRALKESRVLRQPQPDDDIGDTSFMKVQAEAIMVIPDIHAPYQHPDTLAFLRTVRDTFAPDLVVSLGDELDYHALSFHDSDPNLDSAGTELEKAKLFISDMHNEFRNVLVCHSNHGSMVFRRAKAHGIPVQMIKSYREVLFQNNAGDGWSWAESWRVATPLGDVLFKHQTSNILVDAAHNQANLVVGHEHGKFGVEYSASSSNLYYGMYCGCLIDKDSMAFAYGKHSLRKPIVGCGVILNGRPIPIPMVLRADGRWVGFL